MTSNPRARVVIVTGGSVGIGQIAAERLAADGLSVVIHYAGNPAPAKDALTAITAAGGTASSFQADVADETEVAALFDHAAQTYGGIDVVVHTAGIMLAGATGRTRSCRPGPGASGQHPRHLHRRPTSRPPDPVRRGAHHLLQLGGEDRAAALHRLRRRQGRSRCDHADPRQGAERTRHHRQRVAPGPTGTPLFLDGKRQETINELASLPPLQRLGTPEDIAEVVPFLAGPARWVNGQVLYANGGVI